MDKALKSYLRTMPDFEKAYIKAKDYVRENINPYCDTLALSENSNCDICFPITEDNIFILGLDTKSLTFWIFYDTYLADI